MEHFSDYLFSISATFSTEFAYVSQIQHTKNGNKNGTNFGIFLPFTQHDM